jgi:hypothetical protein
MAPVADRPGLAHRAESPRKARVPARPVGEVLRDLERERRSLVDAVDHLKREARAMRDRVFSPRNLAIAGGTLVALVVLRRRRKSRRSRLKCVGRENSD